MTIYKQFDNLAAAILGGGKDYDSAKALLNQLSATDKDAQSIERNSERAKIAEEFMRLILPVAPQGYTIDPNCAWGLLWAKQYWRALYRGADKKEAVLMADWLQKFTTSGRYMKCSFIRHRATFDFSQLKK